MGGVSLRVCVALASLLALPATSAAQIGATTGLEPAKMYGPSFSVPDPRGSMAESSDGGGVTEYDLSLGCIVGGTAGTALSMSAGGMNVVNLIAGGLVPATSPVAMFVALGGVVFASFCSVGQALTPTVMASYAYFVPPEPVFAGPTMEARFCQVAEALTPAPQPSPGRAPQARTVRNVAQRL